jgi:hypothetical protein
VASAGGRGTLEENVGFLSCLSGKTGSGWGIKPPPHIMNAIFQFLRKPVVMAVFVLVACLFILETTFKSRMSEMRTSRSDMVVALRQAGTPEPQIKAISQGIADTASGVGSMSEAYFCFTSVMLFLLFRREFPRKDSQPSN